MIEENIPIWIPRVGFAVQSHHQTKPNEADRKITVEKQGEVTLDRSVDSLHPNKTYHELTTVTALLYPLCNFCDCELYVLQCVVELL